MLDHFVLAKIAFYGTKEFTNVPNSFFRRSLDHAYANKKTDDDENEPLAAQKNRASKASRKHGCLVPRQSVDYKTAVW